MINDPYRRHFIDPRSRPSNQVFADRAVEKTAQTIRRLNQWLDDFDAMRGEGPELVAAAQQLCEENSR